MSAVVPVERLASHGDLFRCEPYSAAITARTCLARQEAAHRAPAMGVSPSPARLAACVNCALGRSVADRLAGCPDDGARPVVPVGARPGQQPLCPTDRQHQETAMETERTEKTEPQLCAAKGCTSPRAVARANTNPATADLCATCRKTAHDRGRSVGGLEAAARALRDGTLPPPNADRSAAGKRSGAARAAKASTVTTSDEALVEHVTRALRVVRQLGGLERAERIAAAMGGS